MGALRAQARFDDLAAVGLLQRVAVIANEAPTFRDAIRSALDEVCTYSGWPVGHVYLTDLARPTELETTDIWHADDAGRFAVFRDITERTPLESGVGLPGRVLQSGKPSWITDVSKDTNFPRNRGSEDIVVRGGFGFPVLASHRVVAVMEFFSDRPERRNEGLLDLLSYVGTQLGRVAEREIAAAAVQKKADEVSRLVELAHDAFVSIDVTGTISGWNATAESTFGWSREEAIGRPLVETIIPPGYRDAHRAGFKRYLETHEPHVLNRYIELAAIRRDGVEFPVELAIWPVEANGDTTFCAFVRDISVRKQTEDRLRESERGLREAQHIVRLGSWEWDVVNDVVSWSDQLYRNFGISSEDLVPSYEGYLDLVHPGDRERVKETIEGALQNHEHFEFDHRVVLPDGTERIHHCTGDVFVEDDRSVRMAGTSQDVTESREIENRLRVAYEREREMVQSLKDLDAAKTTFVSSVSHELRTPLTSITGYIELLMEDGGLSDDQRDMVDVVRRNSVRLLNLIEDLLTVSRLESGTFRVSVEPFELQPLLCTVRQAMLPAATDRSLELDVNVEPGADLVLGDPGQLERMLLNLLSNAVKFTPPGGRVGVDAQRRGDEVVLSVSDTGIGVPTDEQEKLFTRFFRASNAQANSSPGTGLGLAIVKAIVDEHGGNIDVHSVPGEGTTIAVQLKAADAATMPEST